MQNTKRKSSNHIKRALECEKFAQKVSARMLSLLLSRNAFKKINQSPLYSLKLLLEFLLGLLDPTSIANPRMKRIITNANGEISGFAKNAKEAALIRQAVHKTLRELTVNVLHYCEPHYLPPSWELKREPVTPHSVRTG